ncbi:hypothetical protein C8R45DRAFT_935410 [Mycena sanguinolenta]|nr:hypothetical protein C8R45DRAFT_935410 [Mycena sanguinolenta]
MQRDGEGSDRSVLKHHIIGRIRRTSKEKEQHIQWKKSIITLSTPSLQTRCSSVQFIEILQQPLGPARNGLSAKNKGARGESHAESRLRGVSGAEPDNISRGCGRAAANAHQTDSTPFAIDETRRDETRWKQGVCKDVREPRWTDGERPGMHGSTRRWWCGIRVEGGAGKLSKDTERKPKGSDAEEGVRERGRVRGEGKAPRSMSADAPRSAFVTSSSSSYIFLVPLLLGRVLVSRDEDAVSSPSSASSTARFISLRTPPAPLLDISALSLDLVRLRRLRLHRPFLKRWRWRGDDVSGVVVVVLEWTSFMESLFSRSTAVYGTCLSRSPRVAVLGECRDGREEKGVAVFGPLSSQQK